MSEILNRWAKKNGINPRHYSDKELIKLRQLKFELTRSAGWNYTFNESFCSCCKKVGLRVEK